jgi:hypothetical protein
MTASATTASALLAPPSASYPSGRHPRERGLSPRIVVRHPFRGCSWCADRSTRDDDDEDTPEASNQTACRCDGRTVRDRPAEHSPTGDPHAIPTEAPITACSFCGNPDTVVERLVAGPGVYICEGVHRPVRHSRRRRRPYRPEEITQRRSQFYDRSTADILAALPALVRSADRVEGESTGWIGRLRERGTG